MANGHYWSIHCSAPLNLENIAIPKFSDLDFDPLDIPGISSTPHGYQSPVGVIYYLKMNQMFICTIIYQNQAKFFGSRLKNL